MSCLDPKETPMKKHHARTGAALPLTLALATAALAAMSVGCDDKESPKADPSTVAPSASAVAEVAAVPDVDPPPPVVTEDPQIPLHESVVGSTPVGDDYFADTAPPVDGVTEDAPPRPEPNYVWIPGYWWWSRPLARYVWVTGAWRNPPPDQVWTPGSWVSIGPRYYWSPGFWATRGFVRDVVFVDTMPPPLRVEAIGPAPEVGLFWTPGYYAWRSGVYTWVGGNWVRPPVVGLGWIEPRYVTCGPRFYFQPGRWDYLPAMRGTVYAPNITVRAGAHFGPTAVPAAVVNAHASYVSGAAAVMSHGGSRGPSGSFGGAHGVHGGGHGGPGAPAGHGGPAGGPGGPGNQAGNPGNAANHAPGTEGHNGPGTDENHHPIEPLGGNHPEGHNGPGTDENHHPIEPLGGNHAAGPEGHNGPGTDENHHPIEPLGNNHPEGHNGPGTNVNDHPLPEKPPENHGPVENPHGPAVTPGPHNQPQPHATPKPPPVKKPEK
jgi:hypothetical protein